MTSEAHVGADALTEWVGAVLQVCGLPTRHAQIAAEVLVDANLTGVDSGSLNA